MDIKVAGTLARLAQSVYLESDEMGLFAQDLGFSEFDWIESADTQAAVLETDRQRALVFRGTSNVHDWLTNLDAWRGTREEFVGEVHQGFYDALMIVLDDIVPLVQKDHKTLYITGHSLGGALATLAKGIFPHGRLYTFGSPRVGDKEFAESIDNLGHNFRFTNNNDIVPRVPFGDYKHAGVNYHFTHTGRMWSDPEWWMVGADRIVARFVKFRLADGVKDHDMGEYVRLVKQLEHMVP